VSAGRIRVSEASLRIERPESCDGDSAEFGRTSSPRKRWRLDAGSIRKISQKESEEQRSEGLSPLFSAALDGGGKVEKLFKRKRINDLNRRRESLRSRPGL
jgi:hypothetical protein